KAPVAPATLKMTLDDVIAQIDCKTRTMREDGKILSDQELLAVLKCDPVKKIDFKLDYYTSSFYLELESGIKLNHFVTLSFGRDLHLYALRKGINIRTLMKEPGFWDKHFNSV